MKDKAEPHVEDLTWLPESGRTEESLWVLQGLRWRVVHEKAGDGKNKWGGPGDRMSQLLHPGLGCLRVQVSNWQENVPERFAEPKWSNLNASFTISLIL